MRFIKLFLILLPAALTSCSYVSSATGVQSRDKDLAAAYSIPPLKIPPGIASHSFKTYYPVSERNYPASTQQVSLVPPGLDD